MRVTVIGCAGSFPNAASAASCYLVEAEGYRLVVDLGNGALGSLARYCDIELVDAVLISHLHADHCVDLGAFAIARHYRPDGPLPPIPVHAPADAVSQLIPASAMSAEELAERFTFSTLAPGEFQLGPLQVRAERMNHPVETYGFRISQGGWSFAYSADTGECPALTKLAAGTDVLLCEASFPERPGNKPGVHLTGRQAGEHASAARASALVLTHIPAWTDPELARADAAAAFDGPVRLAAPGLRFGPA